MERGGKEGCGIRRNRLVWIAIALDQGRVGESLIAIIVLHDVIVGE